jgi:hypothetical protein
MRGVLEFVCVLLVPCAVSVLPSCSGGGHDLPAPDAGPADGSGSDAPDPLAAFSAASKGSYHLLPDGTIADGRARVLYAPKVMWLDRLSTTGTTLRLVMSVLGDGQRVFGGEFGFFDRQAFPVLAAEATAAGIVLVRADEGVAHATCGGTDLVSFVTFQDCAKDPEEISFGDLAFQGGSKAADADEVRIRVGAHLADGGAWNDLIIGDLTWHPSNGQVLHTKLEVSCIGAFSAAGDAMVHDSPDCHARYQLP